HVSGDGEQPRRDRAAAGVVRLSVPPRTYERLLCGLFRGAVISQDRQRHPVDPALETVDERDGRVRIPRAQSYEQGFIRWRLHGDLFRLPGMTGTTAPPPSTDCCRQVPVARTRAVQGSNPTDPSSR